MFMKGEMMPKHNVRCPQCLSARTAPSKVISLPTAIVLGIGTFGLGLLVTIPGTSWRKEQDTTIPTTTLATAVAIVDIPGCLNFRKRVAGGVEP